MYRSNHLLLDAGAFLLLWNQLPAGRRGHFTILAAAGSLAAVALWPGALDRGLCGLSGVAHGLMAAVGLELLREPAQRRVGAWCVMLVAGKCLMEGIGVAALFSAFHLGPVGSPVPAAHIGGVAGGAIAQLLARVRSSAAGEHGQAPAVSR